MLAGSTYPSLKSSPKVFALSQLARSLAIGREAGAGKWRQTQNKIDLRTVLWARETKKSPQGTNQGHKPLFSRKPQPFRRAIEFWLRTDCGVISGHCFAGSKKKKLLGNFLFSVELYGIVPHLKWNLTFLVRQNKEKTNRYWIVLLSLIRTLRRSVLSSKQKNPSIFRQKASWLWNSSH